MVHLCTVFKQQLLFPLNFQKHTLSGYLIWDRFLTMDIGKKAKMSAPPLDMDWKTETETCIHTVVIE